MSRVPVLLSLLLCLLWISSARAAPAHDAFRLWDKDADAPAQVEAAMARAGSEGKQVLITFGANWCKDSRALASYYSDPELAALLEQTVVQVFVDVGMYHRNIEIAERYGVDPDKGVPAIVILSAQGELVFRNPDGELATALSRNAVWARQYFADLLAPTQ